MEINVYVTCLLFLVLIVGILAGIYAGMSFAVKLTTPKNKPKHKKNVSPRNKWNKDTEPVKKGNRKKRKDARQEKPAIPEEDPMDITPLDGDATMESEKFQGSDVEDEPEDIPEPDEDWDPEEGFQGLEQEEPSSEMEQENDKHSYMEFMCESIGQDAVSRIRAARKTQDNKYMNRMKKKKLAEKESG